jgi:hypothetical protein
VFVPGRAGDGVAPGQVGEGVQGDAGALDAAVLGGQVEAEAVGQRRVPGLQAVVDLDDRLGGAACGGDLGEGTVGQAELFGVVGGSDAARPTHRIEPSPRSVQDLCQLNSDAFQDPRRRGARQCRTVPAGAPR